MWVFFAFLVLAFKVDNINAFADCIVVFVFSFLGIFDQFGKPSIATCFKVDTVIENEVSLRSFLYVFRKWFVLVWVLTNRYDTMKINLVTSDIFSNISNDRVSRYNL